MPYITQKDREKFVPILKKLDSVDGNFPGFSSAGELNYCITMIILEYMEQRGKSYQTINDIMGVLDCAGKEFYDRVVRDYENSKIDINGDVYQ